MNKDNTYICKVPTEQLFMYNDISK